MKADSYLVRYEVVLDLLADGSLPLDEIVYNLEEKYTKKHILETISKMESKNYIKIEKNRTVSKQRDLSTF